VSGGQGTDRQRPVFEVESHLFTGKEGQGSERRLCAFFRRSTFFQCERAPFTSKWVPFFPA
jgi:hypothetical protein